MSTEGLSNGIKVTYGARNDKNGSRSDVKGAVMVSDYLYDMDMTDGYQHKHAQNSLKNLQNRIAKGDYSQKFATVREDNGDGTWTVDVVPTSELSEEDFADKNVYRQGYSKLSDLDISKDGKQIKLYKSKNMFKNQGIPMSAAQSGNNENVLRVPGGAGNFGKYQNISQLDQYGAYLGATVTIVSDDGTIAKKVTGSLRDIIVAAQEIQKQKGGDVHFLQSDAGSMNIKPTADANGNLNKKRQGISRNQEPWAGASEILLK